MIRRGGYGARYQGLNARRGSGTTACGQALKGLQMAGWGLSSGLTYLWPRSTVTELGGTELKWVQGLDRGVYSTVTGKGGVL